MPEKCIAPIAAPMMAPPAAALIRSATRAPTVVITAAMTSDNAVQRTPKPTGSPGAYASSAMKCVAQTPQLNTPTAAASHGHARSDVASPVRWIRPLAVKQENRQISAASTTSRGSCSVPRQPMMLSILSEKYMSELRLRRQPSSSHPGIGEVAAASTLCMLHLIEGKTRQPAPAGLQAPAQSERAWRDPACYDDLYRWTDGRHSSIKETCRGDRLSPALHPGG